MIYLILHPAKRTRLHRVLRESSNCGRAGLRTVIQGLKFFYLVSIPISGQTSTLSIQINILTLGMGRCFPDQERGEKERGGLA